MNKIKSKKFTLKEMPSRKITEANKLKRMPLIKAKFGNDTKETSLKTPVSMGEFSADELSEGRTIFNHKMYDCPAGDYIVEYYIKGEDGMIGSKGILYHNGSKIHEASSKNFTQEDNIFSSLEEITIVEDMKSQNFEIDLEKSGGGKTEMREGVIKVYRKQTYIPPEIIPIDPILPIKKRFKSPRVGI